MTGYPCQPHEDQEYERTETYVSRPERPIQHRENHHCPDDELDDRNGGRLPGEVGMRLRRAPARPRGASRLGLEIARVRQPAWRRFLESAYWEAASAGGR